MEIPVIHGLLEQVADVFCSSTCEDLQEIGIFRQIPPDDVTNAAKKALRRVEGRLGLASWCLTPLYAEARRRLRRERGDVEATTVILVVNPDYRSAWNLRKERTNDDTFPFELLFSELVLTRAPKSAEAWAHRAWLLEKFGHDDALVQRELDIAWRASSRAPHNYYAGVHRLRLLPRAQENVLLDELRRGRKWLHTHVSDASGWWYHGALLEKLGTKVRSDVTPDEEKWFSDMQARYGGKYQNIAVFSKLKSNLLTDKVGESPD